MKNKIRYSALLILLFYSDIKLSFAQNMHAYSFIYPDKSIGQFKLLTTNALFDSLSYSKDSIVLADSTKLQSVSFYRVSNRYGKVQLNNFTVYPNPFTGSFDIDFKSNMEENGRIKIFDALGRNIINEAHNIRFGMNHFRIDFSQYRVGVYFVTLIVGKYQETKRIVKN